jgi:hypothetical protein
VVSGGIVPFEAQQLPFYELEPRIRDYKREFDKEGPCYPFVVKVFGTDGALIMQQVFVGPHSRPKLQVTTVDDWDTPVTLQFSNGHEHVLRSEVMHWVTVSEIKQNKMCLE